MQADAALVVQGTSLRDRFLVTRKISGCSRCNQVKISTHWPWDPHNPNFCKKPIYITYKNSPYIEELSTGKLVNVERRTEVFLEEPK